MALVMKLIGKNTQQETWQGRRSGFVWMNTE